MVLELGLYKVKLSTVAEVGPVHESLFAGSIANTNPSFIPGYMGPAVTGII
jgi:hypothetical protein